MDEITRILPPNPRHVLMPSMIELKDADITDVGHWAPSMCRICRGTRKYVGYKPKSTNEFDTYACPCEEQLTLRRWFAVRGISEIGMQTREADMTGADESWKAAVKEFIDKRDGNIRVGQGMVLHGRSGSGKSSFAWLIMKSLLWAGYSAHAVTSNRLASQSTRWRDREFLDRWNRRVYGCDLLVIDDLGKEVAMISGDKDPTMWSEVVRQSVEDLIVRRISDRRSMVITTNLTEDKLNTLYPRAMESLRGSGSFSSMSLPDSWRDTGLMMRNQFEVDHNIARPAVWA